MTNSPPLAILTVAKYCLLLSMVMGGGDGHCWFAPPGDTTPCVVGTDVATTSGDTTPCAVVTDVASTSGVSSDALIWLKTFPTDGPMIVNAAITSTGTTIKQSRSTPAPPNSHQSRPLFCFGALLSVDGTFSMLSPVLQKRGSEIFGFASHIFFGAAIISL